jgi:hypothetical protein
MFESAPFMKIIIGEKFFQKSFCFFVVLSFFLSNWILKRTIKQTDRLWFHVMSLPNAAGTKILCFLMFVL